MLRTCSPVLKRFCRAAARCRDTAAGRCQGAPKSAPLSGVEKCTTWGPCWWSGHNAPTRRGSRKTRHSGQPARSAGSLCLAATLDQLDQLTGEAALGSSRTQVSASAIRAQTSTLAQRGNPLRSTLPGPRDRRRAVVRTSLALTAGRGRRPLVAGSACESPSPMSSAKRAFRLGVMGLIDGAG